MADTGKNTGNTGHALQNFCSTEYNKGECCWGFFYKT